MTQGSIIRVSFDDNLNILLWTKHANISLVINYRGSNLFIIAHFKCGFVLHQAIKFNSEAPTFSLEKQYIPYSLIPLRP